MLCAHNSTKNDSTCFNKKSLIDIAKVINKNTEFNINTNKTKSEIWKQLLETPYIKCNGICYVDDNILDLLDPSKSHDIKYYTYKPFLPKGQYRWLTNYDIEFLLKQFHKKHKSFTFLGAVPCNYYNLFVKEFKLTSSKKHAIVFNTHGYNQPGEHWVAMFITNNKIEYFDSNGLPPTKCIQQFIDRFLPNYNIIYNKKQFQQNNYACGMYSIHFIVSRLNGISFNKLVNNELIGNDQDQFNNKFFYFI